MKKIVFGLLLSIGLTSFTFAGECDIKKLDPLFGTMKDRNYLMMGVGAYKFMQNQYIYDPEREIEVLKNVQQVASNNKLNSNDLMLFSQAQMDQAKFIQYSYMDYWKHHPKDQPDLSITPGIDSLRKQINQLDDKIYSQIIDNLPQLQICSQEIMLKHLNAQYNNMPHMTAALEYNRLIVSALSNIAPAGQ